MRQQGYTKRQTWRKLNLAVDVASRKIVAAVVTDSRTSDKAVLPDLLNQVASPWRK